MARNMPNNVNYSYIDWQTQSMKIITLEHHQRQLGRSFLAWFVSPTTISTSTNLYFEIRVPAANICELAIKPPKIVTDSIFRTTLIEMPTITVSPTTQIIPVNQDRNSSIVADTVISGGTSCTYSGGTIIHETFRGAGSGSNPISDYEDIDYGYNLKSGQKYLFVLDNVGSQTASFFSCLMQIFEIHREEG